MDANMRQLRSGGKNANLGASPPRLWCSGDRAFRGSAIAPAPPLRAVAASHPSNPLRLGSVRGLWVWRGGTKESIYRIKK
jgi:hypothetical protein